MRLAAGMQKKQWVLCPQDDRAPDLARTLRVSPLVAQVLINRGLADPRQGSIFLAPKLIQLTRPELMPGIGPAADRIRYAIVHKEKITIYGDYDVDGITAVAILWQLFTLLGADVDYYIPHRVDEGYGLNTQAIRTLAQNGTKLLITVDCGITALASADLAGQLGIELIITDHHLPGPKLPQAYAIVHPALDAAYPNPDSSGAMVAFKLAWSIAEQFKSGRSLEPQIREHMLNATALAAMGTVADVVDLRGENRILTSYGLKSLPQCRLPGVQALIESANLTGRGLDTYHIGFRLAPMLNAAGRMGHARLAVELLTTDSHIRAAKIAEYLKDQNTLRQKCEKKIFEQACDMIVRKGLSHPDRKSIVLADESWHTGIIGIVASKLVDRFYRPTVMIGVPARNNHAPNGPAGANPADTIAQGSARSIPGFSLLDAITACSGHLIDFGGHKMAAGFTIKLNKIENFTDDFEQYARQNLREDDIIAKLSIDAVAPLTTFSAEIVKELGLLEPFGQGNHRPIFATNGVRLAAPPRKVGAKSDHLQLTVTDNRTTIRCVGFNFGRLEKKLLEKEFFNIAFEPRLNQYNGATNVECILADIQFD